MQKNPPSVLPDGGMRNKHVSNTNISQFTGIARKNRQNFCPGDFCVWSFLCILICP